MSRLHTILSVVKFDTLSTIRKLKEDWGRSSFQIRHISIILIALYGSLILISSGVAYMAVTFFNLSARVTLELLLIIFSITQLLWGLSFFQKHRKHFFLDMSLFLHQIKLVRILQVHALFISRSIKRTFLIWIAILLPASICLEFLSHHSLTWKLWAGLLHYTLLGYVLASLFSLIQVLFKHLLGTFIRVFWTRLLLFLSSLIIPLAIGYLFFISIRYLNVEKINQWMELDTVRNLVKWVPYVWLSQTSWLGLLITGILLLISSILMYSLWERLLKRFDLIPYMETTAHTYPSSFHFKDSQSITVAIFQKDGVFLRRIHGWFIENISNMVYILMIGMGFILPFITSFYHRYSSETSLTAITFIAVLTYELAGSGIGTMLSADAEAKNIHLLLGRFSTLWSLVSPKLCLYMIFISVTSVFMTLMIQFFISSFLLLNCYVFLVFLTCRSINGMAQISSTALYPKLNWEQVHEIGESAKAKVYRNIYSTVIFTVYLQLSAITDFLLIRH